MVGAVAPRGIGTSAGTGPGSSRSQRFRALRHLISEFQVGVVTASAWHPALQTITALCENISLHGLGIRIPGGAGSAHLIQVDDRLTGLHVTLSTGEVVFHGDAVVRQTRLDTGGQDLLVGLLLQHGAADLLLLHEHQARGRFSVRCDEAERAADTQSILPQFKEWVADLRSYLETMRDFLDREEAALSGEDLYTRERMRAQYLEEVGPRIVQRVHEASHAMGAMLSGLSEEEHALHRPYAQHHLSTLFDTAPLLRRALHKPLGYAGDYEMMNMLYRPPEEGSSLFGQVMNMSAVGEDAAQAIINRVVYLSDKLRVAIRSALVQNGGARARLASIGCGPAREIGLLLEREPHLGPRFDAMLVDQDTRAISFCERNLSPIARQTGAQLHFVRESIRRLLTGGLLSHTLGHRDLIYSAGLFDYLSDRSFSALLMALYDAVAPGGSLVVGNLDVNNPTRYFMEYFLEWFLVHRSKTQLLEQARVLRPAPRSVRVESEDLGVNLFLIIEK